MSNEFLRSYTIPTLQKNETETTAPTESTEMALEATPGISYYSRYLPPGRQVEIHNLEMLNSRKRPINDATLKCETNTENSEVRIPIFTGRDRSYPDELNLLINPLSCDLCKVRLNSQKTAACHYESKLHDRKITAWLAERYPDNPPPVKRFLKDGPTGPDAFRCEICDLPLTSIAHAKQHYAGRKHRLVANKKSDPSGAGYYDSEGKWIRTGTKKFNTKNDGSRFGIGEDFVPADASPAHELNEKGKISNVVSPKPVKPIDESLCCKICDVLVTSSTQMSMHLSGAKHKKKMATGEVVENIGLLPESNEMNVNSILATINDDIKPLGDLSMYRTPTGSYYCQICNTTMNHVTVLQKHIQGKKHKIKEKSIQTNSECSPIQ